MSGSLRCRPRVMVAHMLRRALRCRACSACDAHCHHFAISLMAIGHHRSASYGYFFEDGLPILHAGLESCSPPALLPRRRARYYYGRYMPLSGHIAVRRFHYAHAANTAIVIGRPFCAMCRQGRKGAGRRRARCAFTRRRDRVASISRFRASAASLVLGRSAARVGLDLFRRLDFGFADSLR